MNQAIFEDLQIPSQGVLLNIKNVTSGAIKNPDCLMVLPGYLSRRSKYADVLSKHALEIGVDLSVIGFQGWDNSDVRLEDTSQESHVADTLSLYQHLLKQYERVHLYGTSYGAYIGANAFANGAHFSSICLRTPAVYFETDFNTPSNLVDRDDKVQSLRRNKTELGRHSLLNRLWSTIDADPTPALIVAHGDDSDTPLASTMAYASSLSAAVYIAPGVQHSAKDALSNSREVALSDAVYFAWLRAIVAQ
ncbi:hypothetical protein JNM87_02395 [Candidatus Saccharibacteria bacterium]|nr:hypothetical protein [Candidatus Saccharibacteria bacterium]